MNQDFIEAITRAAGQIPGPLVVPWPERGRPDAMRTFATFGSPRGAGSRRDGRDAAGPLRAAGSPPRKPPHARHAGLPWHCRRTVRDRRSARRRLRVRRNSPRQNPCAARQFLWPRSFAARTSGAAARRNPVWAARNLFNAFVESKRRSLERLLDPAVSRYPLPWLPAYARKMRDMFDGDPFPYGIEENRPTFEQFLRYAHEQGIAKRHVKPEEIFPKGIMTPVRI